MSFMSAHVEYLCLDCEHRFSDDLFDLASKDDVPTYATCPECGHEASEDGIEVYVDGKQIESDDDLEPGDDSSSVWECEACGYWMDDDTAVHAQDRGHCPKCGNDL